MAKINESTQLPLERKYQVFVNGYELQTVSGITPGLASRELNTPVYGSDDSLKDTITDNGTLTLDVLEKSNNNYLMDNLCNVNPSDSVKGYNFASFTKVAMWQNRKSYDNSKYIGCEFYGRVSMTPSGKSGAPNEWSSRTFSGLCDAPLKFEGDNVAIAAEKVSITAGAGTLTNVPYQRPDNSLYALYVVALDWDAVNGDIDKSEILTVTATMVEADKSVTIVAGDLNEMAIGDVNAAFVVYLYSGSGIYPTGAIRMDGLYSALA
jgi:hypothetical protein